MDEGVTKLVNVLPGIGQAAFWVLIACGFAAMTLKPIWNKFTESSKQSSEFKDSGFYVTYFQERLDKMSAELRQQWSAIDTFQSNVTLRLESFDREREARFAGFERRMQYEYERAQAAFDRQIKEWDRIQGNVDKLSELVIQVQSLKS